MFLYLFNFWCFRKTAIFRFPSVLSNFITWPKQLKMSWLNSFKWGGRGGDKIQNTQDPIEGGITKLNSCIVKISFLSSRLKNSKNFHLFLFISRTFQGCDNFSRTFQWINSVLPHMSVLHDSNSYYTINITSIPLADTGIHQRGFISGVSPDNQQYVCILKEIVHPLISTLTNYT